MRIHDDEEDRDDAPPLPERAVLDAWTVPEPAAELTDRVLEHVEAALASGSEGAESMEERRRGGFGWALIGVAMVAAAALVLGLVQLWRVEPMQPATVAAPVVVTVPVPVPIPSASPPTTAPPTPPPVPADEATPERVDPPAPDERAPDLEDPFAREPAAKEPRAPVRSSKEPDASKDLMDPFERKAKEDAPKDGTLRIGTQRGYGPAHVYIDGKKIGMTPLMSIEVTAGRHTVKWVWADGESAQVSIVVEAGETRTLKGPLSDLKDPYAERD